MSQEDELLGVEGCSRINFLRYSVRENLLDDILATSSVSTTLGHAEMLKISED
jgi:hypothetical protein